MYIRVCVCIIIVNFPGSIQVLELGSPHIVQSACCSTMLSTGLFTVNDVHNMTDEILKMKLFDHPNVMTLIGVCVSIGGGPAIIMPYMENGSLLSYLRKDKKNITTSDDQDLETVSYMLLVLLSFTNKFHVQDYTDKLQSQIHYL